MTDPIALTVHNGGLIPGWRRELIASWLTTNGIRPDDVHANSPITVLTVPYNDGSEEGPWLIKVIAFTQLYVNDAGRKEWNFLTREPVTFQRTVPLRTPFPPPHPGDEGDRDGQEPEVPPVEEGQRPQEHEGGPQAHGVQAVRPAQAEEVQDRRSPAREERPRKGVGSRITGAEEGSEEGRGAQVPQPEEEEVAP